MSKARLIIGKKEVDLDIIEGTQQEKAINIEKLRSETGYITMDPGYANTGSCISKITFIDGEKGILNYRGYPIDWLCKNSNFVDVSHLLIYGDSKSKEEKEKFRLSIRKHATIPEDMKRFFDGFPSSAHPMAILSSMVTALSVFHPNSDSHELEKIDENIVKLLAKVKTIAAYSYRKSHGLSFIYPDANFSYVENFLHMMFSDSELDSHNNSVMADALNLLLILHADHEQNCSTSTVRMAGSSYADLFATISAGISALWGPRHGGANQAVIEMLEKIHKDGDDYKKYVSMAKDKNSDFRLMGFGHRVYKNYDPRARILKEATSSVLNQLKIQDPLLEIAKELERVALNDEYFIVRKLYPNVDFYSGIIYRAMGIPTNMFTVMFALGRLPGWLAHWREMIVDSKTKINRPRQIYSGPADKA
ncbi:MAG: citrate (Si)-synthase [Candidatus Marinimicrobia bacterium]|nr:citrate (Si)-synthase [Candidatus Neomarinimicrobiota bacterium]